MSRLIKALAAVAACTIFTGAFAQSGVVSIPYRVENFRVLPVGGPAARNVSPRVGHLHITVDDLPWQWADYGQSNTVILGGHAAGPAQGADRAGGRRRQRLYRTNG